MNVDEQPEAYRSQQYSTTRMPGELNTCAPLLGPPSCS